MGKILIVNGSPRAPRSNSRRYAELFAAHCSVPAEYAAVSKKNHAELCAKLETCSDVLFVFPLYADGVPVTLLAFLNSLAQNPPKNRPRVSVLVNCGFLEPEQNDTAVRIVRCFCAQEGYPFGSVLRIGSGEAVLDTPFRFFAARAVKRLAAAVSQGRCVNLKATMPLPKRLFLRASTSYWEAYGRKNGVTPEQMASMEIEP